jgi:outer membrane protein
VAETWSASIAVQVPFFTGGQREIELVNAQAEIEKASLQRELLLEKIEAEVKQACLNVETLKGSLAAVRAQVAAAEQSYKDLQNQYAAGTSRSVDVLFGLQDLSTARLDLTSLSLDYQVALRALERVSGTFQELRVKTAYPR